MNRSERKRQQRMERRLAKEPYVWDFKYNPKALRFHGPVIKTSIIVSRDHEAALKSAGLPVPAPVVCRFLLDTGAYSTLVRHDIAEGAGLKLINTSSPVRGIGQDDSGRTYFGRIVFARQSTIIPEVQQTAWIEAQIASANLPHAQHFDGLIGRDVLEHFDLRYNGRTGEFTMRYIGPRTHPQA